LSKLEYLYKKDVEGRNETKKRTQCYTEIVRDATFRCTATKHSWTKPPPRRRKNEVFAA